MLEGWVENDYLSSGIDIYQYSNIPFFQDSMG
jgi:hypothetical protein